MRSRPSARVQAAAATSPRACAAHRTRCSLCARRLVCADGCHDGREEDGRRCAQHRLQALVRGEGRVSRDPACSEEGAHRRHARIICATRPCRHQPWGAPCPHHLFSGSRRPAGRGRAALTVITVEMHLSWGCSWPAPTLADQRRRKPAARACACRPRSSTRTQLWTASSSPRRHPRLSPTRTSRCARPRSHSQCHPNNPSLSRRAAWSLVVAAHSRPAHPSKPHFRAGDTGARRFSVRGA